MKTVHSANEEISPRRKITADVFTNFQEMQELTDGYALRYPDNAAWHGKLTSFTEIWRQNCPYFTFEIVPETARKRIWLRITGPEGAKRFVENAHEMLNSHLNPAPNLKYAMKWKFAGLTSRIRVLPDFLIIGAKKCGTTSLYSYLTQHPGVAPAFKKEIYFFDGFFKKGIDSYRAFFPTAIEKFYANKIRRKDFITGEASPEYMLSRKVAKRVFKTLPQVRLIAILRNPVDKAYSYYQHQLRTALENVPFEDAIERELQQLRQDKNYFSRVYSYLATGIYVDQLKVWRRYFPMERILILTNEELDKRPAETVARAFDFLDLPCIDLKTYKKLNAYPYADMDPATRARLMEYFKPHNNRLYKFLGRDLGWDG